MSLDFSGYFEEIRGEIGAPELSPQEGTRAFQALVAPAFDPPFAVSVGDFGDHADVTLHGQALELVDWERGHRGWRRRPGGVWRESKTIVGEPLDAFRRSLAEIALDRLTDRIEEGGRDGILLQLTVCLGDQRRVLTPSRLRAASSCRNSTI